MTRRALAARQIAADLAPEVAGLLGKIARGAETFALTRLGPEPVAEWLREALPSATVEHAAPVYELTEGHPLP